MCFQSKGIVYRSELELSGDCLVWIIYSYMYYRVIALISANIVPSLDIEGRKLASVRRYPNEGQFSPISVR